MLIQSLLIHRCLERAFNLIEADGTELEGRKKEGSRGFVPAGFFAQLVRSCADGGGGWPGGSGGGPDVSWGRRPPCNTPQATCRRRSRRPPNQLTHPPASGCSLTEHCMQSWNFWAREKWLKTCHSCVSASTESTNIRTGERKRDSLALM